MQPMLRGGRGDPIAAERIAVVFVHGQGQQTPMTDVLDLAESVWRTEPRAAGSEPLAPVYSVPIYDGDDAEQRRVVTEEVDGPNGPVQVDFFQFYWADLMQGNRFDQLWGWFIGLVQKDPRTNVIPPAIQPLRRLTLGIAYGVGLWGTVLAACTAVALVAAAWECAFAWWAAIILALGLAQAIWDRVAPKPGERRAGAAKPPWTVGLFELVSPSFVWAPMLIAAGLAIGCWKLAGLATPPTFVQVASVVLWAAAMTAARALLRPKKEGLGFAFNLALPLIGICCAIGPFAAALRGGMGVFPIMAAALDWMLVLTVPSAILGVLIFDQLTKSFLVPVMTESARMFTAAPENVHNQEAVRERGVKLLEYLHEADAGYDRIVVLAHSLGTAVAYNLLVYYWGKVNGDLNHADTAEEREAVERSAGKLISEAAQPGSETFASWRAAVRAYGRVLRTVKRTGRQSASPWRISDFITIGSPLTYAPFLMEKSDDLFIDQVQTYRRYPLCPPQSVNGESVPYKFTFDHGAHEVPHHAALFAATTWTNLFFPSRGVIWGDLIGGVISAPLAGKIASDAVASRPQRRGLGPGVLDCALQHDRRLGPFNHNDYWPWPSWAGFRTKVCEPDKTAQPPQHIRMLRSAFHFFEDPAKADADLAGSGG